MLPPEAFATHTLAAHPHGAAVQRILAAALQAVEPGEAVRRFVRCRGRTLYAAGRAYPLPPDGGLRILAVGKAALAMARSLAELLPAGSYRGLLVPKHAAGAPPGFALQPGGHPLPTSGSLRAGELALELASGLGPGDLLVCLISGGGSALLAAPPPGVGLADLQALTALLLSCGARIDEINTLRRRLDRLKGGGLAQAAAPARVLSLILSDVVDNPLETIASGPTAPDPTSRAQALAIVEKYGVRARLPQALLAALEEAPETPKPGDGLFERVQNVLVGSNQLALQAALQQAEGEGFAVRSLGSGWQGETRQVSLELWAHWQAAPERRPFCLAAGGETTVTLRGSGRGGRNQELALAAVTAAAGQPALLVTLATDGEDGPTDAAGAVVSGETLRRGQALGLEPGAFLENNDAYTYFQALGDLLRPGPSGTNVNDLAFLFGF